MTTDIDVELGRRLRLLRATHSVTQTDLAEHLGISFQQVQKYEIGSNRISTSTLIRICRYFKIDPGMFLSGFMGDIRPNASAESAGPSNLMDALSSIESHEIRKLLEQLIITLSKGTALQKVPW